MRKFYTFRVNDATPDDHLGRLGEITYRDGYLYYHDGVTPGGTLVSGGGGGGGPTSWASITGKPSFATVATSGSYADLTNKPTLPTKVSDLTNDSGFISSVTWTDVTGKPSLFSGAYADLTGKPTLFDGAYSSLTGKPSFATVATSGEYADLLNSPVISDSSSLNPGDSFILKSADTVSFGHYAAQNITAGPSGIQIAGTGGVTIMGVASAGVTLGGQTSGPITFSSATSGINYNDLSNLPSIPAAQVNADWNETASESPAYIFNKPTIPSLDGYATEAWVNAQGFGSGGSGVSLPANASGYLTNDGAGNLAWAAGDGTFSGDYNDLVNKPSIPSDTSDLTNSAGFITSADIPSIPTDINQLTDTSNLLSNVTSEITNTDGSNTYSVSVGTDGVITMTTARGSIEFGAMPEVGSPQHLHIMRPAGQEGATDLYFGDDYNYVKLPGLYGINTQGVEIGSSYNGGTVSTWKFDTAGHLVPGNDILQDIGTPTNRVRHIYVGPGSITVGNSVITESTTGKLVLPGVTRATSAYVDEVDDTGDQFYTFTNTAVAVDYILYQAILNGTDTTGYADYTVNLDDSGYIDEIQVNGQGTYTDAEAVQNRNNDMYVYAGSGSASDRPINPQDWVQVPFRPRMKANDVEYEFSSGGGATELDGLEDVSIIDPQGGQSLVYDAIEEQWVNGTPSSGGSLTISDGNGTSVSNVNTILIDSNNFVEVGEGVVGLTNLGGGSSSTKTWTNPNENTWRIEEYNGGAAVGYIGTPITSTITATATETLSDVTYVDIDDSTFPGFYGGNIMSITINGIDYGLNGNEWLGGGTTYRYNLSATTSYTTGDTITATIQTGSNPPEPAVWWDVANSTNGNENFRGAIIEYHAYCDNGGTVIGKIIIAADDENAITHMEAMSGGSNLSEYELWYAPEYGQLAVRRVGTDATDSDDQIWIQWTSKIFYGSEYWC